MDSGDPTRYETRPSTKRFASMDSADVTAPSVPLLVELD